MKCKYHNNADAVWYCEKCWVGICSDCFDNTKFNWNWKPACYDCWKIILEDLISNEEENIFFSKLKIGLLVVTIIWWWLYYYFNQEIIMTIVILSIWWLPTAWKITALSENDKLMDSLDDKIASVDNPWWWIITFVVRNSLMLAFRFAIAAIASPILLIMNINKISKSKKELNSLLELKE